MAKYIYFIIMLLQYIPVSGQNTFKLRAIINLYADTVNIEFDNIKVDSNYSDRLMAVYLSLNKVEISKIQTIDFNGSILISKNGKIIDGGLEFYCSDSLIASIQTAGDYSSIREDYFVHLNRASTISLSNSRIVVYINKMELYCLKNYLSGHFIKE